MRALCRPVLGNACNFGPATVQHVLDMCRQKPHHLGDLARGLFRRPDLVLPAVQEARAEGLLVLTPDGYSAVENA